MENSLSLMGLIPVGLYRSHSNHQWSHQVNNQFDVNIDCPQWASQWASQWSWSCPDLHCSPLIQLVIVRLVHVMIALARSGRFDTGYQIQDSLVVLCQFCHRTLARSGRFVTVMIALVRSGWFVIVWLLSHVLDDLIQGVKYRTLLLSCVNFVTVLSYVAGRRHRTCMLCVQDKLSDEQTQQHHLGNNTILVTGPSCSWSSAVVNSSFERNNSTIVIELLLLIAMVSQTSSTAPSWIRHGVNDLLVD